MSFKIKTIPHIRLTIGQAEAKAVTQVLQSGYLAMGLQAQILEKKVALLAKQKYAAVVSSGTTALHLALLSLGVKEGDEVILPDYSCQALLNAVLYTGARPQLVDIDLATFNISPEAIKKVISKKTKAIIVPHMFGLMADMPALKKLGIPIVEDCAMSIGSALSGQPAGSFGDVAVFSFYATKTITGGEGGMVVTSNKKIIDQILDLREYDKKRDFKIRYNYKLSDLNAAIALVQLSRLDTFITKRQAVAKRYQEALGESNFILPLVPAKYKHSFARYVILGEDGDRLRAYLKKNQVMAGRGVVFGLHELIKTKNHFPVSDTVLKRGVSLPIYPTLTVKEQKKVIDLLLDFKH